MFFRQTEKPCNFIFYFYPFLSKRNMNNSFINKEEEKKMYRIGNYYYYYDNNRENNSFYSFYHNGIKYKKSGNQLEIYIPVPGVNKNNISVYMKKNKKKLFIDLFDISEEVSEFLPKVFYKESSGEEPQSERKKTHFAVFELQNEYDNLTAKLHEGLLVISLSLSNEEQDKIEASWTVTNG